jgi:Magnesium chelatase, subunit ChlI C-terminal
MRRGTRVLFQPAGASPAVRQVARNQDIRNSPPLKAEAVFFESDRLNVQETRPVPPVSKMIRKHCTISADGEKLLENAISRLGLSARAHDRILKVARTIADLDGVESIEPRHLNEAIQYRTLDRTYWA